MKSNGDKSFYATASFDRNVGELNSDTDITIHRASFQPSLSHFEESQITINHIIPGTNSTSELDDSFNTQVVLGANERLIETISQKDPFYENYEDYAQDEKQIVKEASILPEFRISEHMPFYVEENAGNFRAKNKKFLSLLGSENSSSAENYASVTFNKSFEQDHLLSGEVENFKKIKNDHVGFSKPRKITIRAKGVQKLLPYNGFYPDTRTVQIGNVLSSSLSAGIKSYRFQHTTTGDKQETELPTGYFGFLKTMSSPGILHNSIKSGVSVDYPVFLNPPVSQNERHDAPTGDMKLLQAPEARLPFEALYNLDKGLPKNTSIYPVFSGDKLQDKKDSSPFYYEWNGNKKPSYELAMHNFLAESVQFFLKGSSLNTFISQPESKFLEVEADKKYYLDVVMDDQTARNKFINLKGQAQAFPNFSDQQSTASFEGEGSDFGFSSDVVHDNNGGFYSIVGAPGAPDNTDVGKIVLNHVDADGNKTILAEGDQSNSAGDRFGASVSICSGSVGVFFAVGAPGVDSDKGQVYYYSYSDALGVDVVTDLTAITPSVNDYYGTKLKCLYHEGDEKVYIGVTDVGSGNNTEFYLNSIDITGTGDATNVATSTFTNGNKSGELVDHRHAFGMSMVELGSENVLALISSQKYESGGNKGAVKAHWWNDSTSTLTTDGPFVDIANASTGGFGSDISVVETFWNSTTSTSYGLVAVGRSESLISGWSGDSVVLYEVLLTDAGDFDLSTSTVLNTNITSLGPSSTFGLNNWGQNVSLNFDNLFEEVLLAVSHPFWGKLVNGNNNQLGAIEVQKFPKKFDINGRDYFFPTGTLRNFIEPDYDNKEFMASPRFGDSLSTDLLVHDYLIAAGSPDYSGSLAAGGTSHVLFSSPSYQDYKQHGKLFGFPVDGTYDPSYCAYTPPGFYGEAVARLSFSSSIAGQITLEEIFKQVEIEDITTLSPDRQRITTGSAVTSLTTMQENSKMNLSSSVALFERVINPGVQFNISEDGAVTTADRAVPSSRDSVRWAISTRYECPVINVSSSEYESNYSSFDPIASASFLELDEGTFTFEPPQSTWTSYGSGTNDNGYKFTLRESFNTGDFDASVTGSLIDLCGFTPGTKNLGSLADNKTISEAIMVIPYTDREINRKTVEIESGKHFFRINAAEIKRQKKSLEDEGFAVSEEIRETSISELLEGLKEYVVPPQYNFLKYKDIKPFAVYFLEFEHTLTQEDLKDIWQGISPSIGINPETQEIEISHNIDKHNMLYKVDIPNDIKFMVFKVKKKAEWNYYNITTDSTDDDRFRFDFQGNGQVEVVPEYSYNWPYDYFTLVERAKVDVDFTFEKPEEEE